MHFVPEDMKKLCLEKINGNDEFDLHAGS